MIRKLALLLLGATMMLRADDAADKLTASGIAEFNAAWRTWDGARFWNAAEIFRKAAAKTPRSSVNHYWLGTARFHRMLQLHSLPASKAHSQAADAEMDLAMQAFETALDLDSRDAESHALLGTLYGTKIKGGMLRGIRYGPSVQDHRKQALKLGPDNPRVRYLLGAGLFHTAKDDAGRKDALKELLAAEKLFDAERKRPAKPFEPRWGRSACLTFIGRTYALLGQNTEAADYFRKALAEHPADQVAKDGLARLNTAN
jgi:tetratricopeptide (TPR) repeat protein